MFIRSLRIAFQARHKLALFSLMHDARGFVRVQFLNAAVRSGLAAALRLPATRDELAVALAAARPELLDALLDVGLSLGELALSRGRYRVRSRVLRAMQEADGDGLAALAEAFATYYSASYVNLPERLAGAPLGGEMGWIGPMVARYSTLVEPYVSGFVAAGARGRAGLRVLDVGCGSGINLRGCAEANPGAVGVGLERDRAVAAQARANLEAWGLGRRFTVQEGDLADPGLALEPGFGLIVFANLVYYFPPGERVALYRRLAGWLAPGGSLALVNMFQGRGRDPFSANLNVATCSMQGFWPLPDLEETRAQLADAGLPGQKVERLMPGSTFYGIMARAE